MRSNWLGAKAVLFGLAALGLMLVGRGEASGVFAMAVVLRFALGGISGLGRADRLVGQVGSPDQLGRLLSPMKSTNMPR